MGLNRPVTTLEFLPATTWAGVVSTDLLRGPDGNLAWFCILLFNRKDLIERNFGLPSAVVVFLAKFSKFFVHPNHAMNGRAVGEGQPDFLDMATLVDSLRVGNEKYLPLPIRFRRYPEKSTVRADPHGMKLTSIMLPGDSHTVQPC